jgi:hypothetical protein
VLKCSYLIRSTVRQFVPYLCVACCHDVVKLLVYLRDLLVFIEYSNNILSYFFHNAMAYHCFYIDWICRLQHLIAFWSYTNSTMLVLTSLRRPAVSHWHYQLTQLNFDGSLGNEIWLSLFIDDLWMVIGSIVSYLPTNDLIWYHMLNLNSNFD